LRTPTEIASRVWPLTAGSDAVILMLPNSEAVEEVLVREGLLDLLEPGSICHRHDIV